MIWKGWNVILCGKIGFTMLVIWKYALEVKYMLIGKSCSQQQKSFGTILMASHCPSIHCLLINWTIGNKIQWNMNQNNNWKFHMEMSSAKPLPFQTSFSFPIVTSASVSQSLNSFNTGIMFQKSAMHWDLCIPTFNTVSSCLMAVLGPSSGTPYPGPSG